MIVIFPFFQIENSKLAIFSYFQKYGILTLLIHLIRHKYGKKYIDRTFMYTCSQKQFSRFQHSRHCPSRFSLDRNRIERNVCASQLQDIPFVCTPPLRHTYPIHRHKLNPRFRGDRFRCCPK